MPHADEMLAVAASRRAELAAGGLGPRPRRKVAVLACMDARMDLFAMLGLARGDAHIIRNAGGLVTDDAVRSLSVSQRLLGTEEVVIVIYWPHGNGADAARLAQQFFQASEPPAPVSARALTVELWSAQSITHLTATQPANLPPTMERAAGDPTLRRMNIGVCFRPDDQNKFSKFWVVAAFYTSK